MGVTSCRRPLLSKRNKMLPVSRNWLKRLYLNPTEPLLTPMVSFPAVMVGKGCDAIGAGASERGGGWVLYVV